ncbi:hypothetical protein HAX54_008294 [Datura stramonium]|uniref:Cupin type-1 domain-containing protein n=1 Tax=Datura stramonium TaxID=4076 RepID=A0ABS8RVZ4_DATST|nr:hypothetical protein [Datura stramonium]
MATKAAIFANQQSRGFYGIMNSGCPETFQSSQQIRQGIRGRRFRDRHQRIEQFRQGDIVAIPAGRFTTVNSFTLPILSFLGLSASRGVLYRNSMMAPHWYQNAHSIIYMTKGESRIQVVDHRGQAVLDDQVREGQFIVVPQNHAVVKQTGNEGCEWITFNTNDNAMINTLSGRTSSVRGHPLVVIANAYQISRDEARILKFNREETLLFSLSTRSRTPYERVVSA